MKFLKKKGVSPLIAAVLLIAFTMAVAAILTAWITSFTKEQKESSEKFEDKISCAYSNIEIDKAFTKFDQNDKIFYAFVSNTGVDPISITKAEIWVDGEKQLPIKFDTQKVNLTTIPTDDYIQFYTNISSAFEENPTGSLTEIKFITECDSVFDRITTPQGGWTTFDWTDEELVN